MRTHGLNIDVVTALIDEIAREVILPRFRQLQSEDIEEKPAADGGHDIVTIVDRQVEDRLTRALTGIAPAAVIGEEAAHEDPDLLQLVHGDDPLWVVDPIDGTKNFARGHDAFGVMVAWVVAGRAQSAWVLLPARHQMFVADAGGGAWLNGSRIHVPAAAPASLPRGTLHQRYMSAALADAMAKSLAGKYVPVADLGCSAIEYTDILQGHQEFTTYYRLLPWDHAAPALVLTEGGGAVDHVSGKPYSVRSANQVTVVACDARVSAEVRTAISRHVYT